VDGELRTLAEQMEAHEVAVWAQCVDAVSALPGNPLAAVIDRSGRAPLVALCAVDRGDFNRVIALGIDEPTRPEELDAVVSFYREHGQENFVIEVTPLTRPPELADWAAARGMVRAATGTFKMWRPVDPALVVPADIEVRRLGPDDTEAVIAVNTAAWGAWSTAVSVDAWFAATMGSAGVQHYGVFEAERLVAAGALFIGDGLGWFGFDATHPRYQGRKLRQAISAVRLADAVAQGCRIVHAESAVPPGRRALNDGWRLLYEKQNYAPPRPAAGDGRSAPGAAETPLSGTPGS
jgi:hypothetical protein